MGGAIICALALNACGYFIWLDANYTPQVVVACVIIFNASFGFSWGPIPWLYPSEIMPLAFRAKGASLACATNWAFNWLIGEATPVLQEAIKWKLYPMHGAFCIGSFFITYFFYPETARVPLEAIDELFLDWEPASNSYDDDDHIEPTDAAAAADEEEEAARKAAAREAQDNAGTFLGFQRPRWLGGNTPDRSAYEPVRSDDH